MIIGIGCDLVEIERLKANQDALAKRLLTIKEYETYLSFRGHRALEFLAGRFAAKEAIFKAIKMKSLTLGQIEVLVDESGCPVCPIEGYKIHLSISHEKKYAMAYVIVEK